MQANRLPAEYLYSSFKLKLRQAQTSEVFKTLEVSIQIETAVGRGVMKRLLIILPLDCY